MREWKVPASGMKTIYMSTFQRCSLHSFDHAKNGLESPTAQYET